MAEDEAQHVLKASHCVGEKMLKWLPALLCEQLCKSLPPQKGACCCCAVNGKACAAVMQ
jgi:hypothetical protein